MKKTLSLLVGLFLLFSPFGANANEVPEPDSSSANVLLVKISDTSSSTLEQIESIPGVTITDVISDTLLLVESTTTPTQSVNTLVDLPTVSYAEPNFERMPFVISTSDNFADRMWALDNTGQSVNGITGTSGDDIDALLAWNLSFGTSTTVAVIDSGVLYTHPDLSNNMWDGTSCVDENGGALGNCIHGYDFADNDLDPTPQIASTSYSHGTHIAGTIASIRDNGTGTIGVAPSSKIMALRFGFDTATEIRAIDFARQNGVKIINASFGGTQYSQSEYDSILRFTSAGGLFIAASGNSSGDSDTAPIYPAAYDIPGIISVSATDQNDDLAFFSNYGSTTVDIAAPGVNIASTYVTSSSTPTYAYSDGTSMAAPHVAGVVALIKSLYSTLSSTEIKEAILSGGDTVTSLNGKVVSGKRLNAYGALVAANPADITPPIISLTGASSISLTVGDSYAELGATAFDARDGTTTVTIGGDVVTTSVAGTYHVTYDAVDLAGNHAVQVVRTVIVTAPVVVSSGGGGSSSSSTRVVIKKKYVEKKVVVKTPTPAVPRPALNSQPDTTSTTPGFIFTRQLGVGSAGADVTALQQTLIRLGVYTGPVTGYFGPLTQAGVRAYQIRHGLSSVGFVGPLTRALLTSGV